jgi:hypothetical protein
MADEVELIIQVPHDSSVSRDLREEPPDSVVSGRAVVEHLPVGEDGRLLAPEGGELVMSVPSPEALRREADEVRRLIRDTDEMGEPLVVVIEGAEYLRDDELAAMLAAAGETNRVVILRIMEGV